MLLVEDDDGDALIVEGLFEEVGAPVALRRVRTVGEARHVLAQGHTDCVLLDLGLPDAHGLTALERIVATANGPGTGPAVLVLTGDRDATRGLAAVAAGAQDYLVKGAVDGDGLLRAVRYAVERRQAAAVLLELHAARLQAQEATRLERGLLPVPQIDDPALVIGTGYRPGRARTLLGGDFYDAVRTDDGAVHLLIGDVCGHGPDEAALGVCLRVAWRTQTLGGAPDAGVLPTLQRVLEYERAPEWTFATVLTVSIASDRSRATVRTAGHPPPVLLGDGAPRALEVAHHPPLGVVPGGGWPATDVPLPPGWGLLLFTDGLIEGRAGPASRERLGIDGLLRLLSGQTDWRANPTGTVGSVIAAVQERHGGPTADDLAALLLAARA